MGICCAVRPLLLLLFVLLSVARLRAQEQEQKMLDRITKPNMSLEYDVSKSSFGNRSATIKSTKATTKDFGGSKAFTSKEFAAKGYSGAKSSWFSSLFFSTKSAAAKGQYEIPNAGEKFETKGAGTKEARETEKSMNTTAYAGSDETYLKPGHRDRWGRSQDRFDIEKGTPLDSKPIGYTGDMKPMTIDDVRDLLNKNK